MIPLSLFLLACVAVYLGTIEAAFSALMRLSLRLEAERSDRHNTLGAFLDEPFLLVGPLRLLIGLVTVTATVLLARAIGVSGAYTVVVVFFSATAFLIVFGLVLPVAIMVRDPDRTRFDSGIFD